MKKFVSLGLSLVVAVAVGFAVGGLHSNAHYGPRAAGCTSIVQGCHSQYCAGSQECWNHWDWCKQEFCPWISGGAGQPVVEPVAAESQPVVEPVAAESQPVVEPVAAESQPVVEPVAAESQPEAEEPVAEETVPVVEQAAPADQAAPAYEPGFQGNYDDSYQCPNNYDCDPGYYDCDPGYCDPGYNDCTPQYPNSYGYGGGHHSGGHHGRGGHH